jgi:hypothetical protein
MVFGSIIFICQLTQGTAVTPNVSRIAEPYVSMLLTSGCKVLTLRSAVFLVLRLSCSFVRL